eukprot:403363825
MPAWSVVPTSCKCLNLEFYFQDGSLCNFITADPSFTSFNVYSDNIFRKGLYNLTVKGYYYATTKFATAVFQARLKINCASNVLSTNSSGLLNSYSYNITTSQMNISFLDFSEFSDGECGNFTYSLHNPVNQAALSLSYIQLDSNLKQIYIQTNDTTLNDTYVRINVKGTISGVYVDQQIKIYLIYNCYVQKLTPQDNYLKKIEYRIGQGIKEIEFLDFKDYEDCIYPIFYTYQPIQKLSGILDGTQIGSRKIKILSNDKKMGFNPDYNIQVIASVQNRNDTVYGDLIIPIKFVAVNNAPPVFVNPLPLIYIAQGTKMKYEFPDIFDSDMDNYFLFDINMNTFQQFVKEQFPILQIQPTNYTIEGQYKIRLTLADDNPTQLFQKYELKIIVTKSETKIEYNTSIEISDKNLISKTITAKIKSIDLKGVVQVFFNKELIVPLDYWKFDSQILKLQILDEDGQIDKDIFYSWKTKHRLKITFIANSLFKEKSSGLYIAQNYETQKQIPKQLQNDVSSNTLLFYSLLIDMSQFDIIPTEVVENSMFTFTDSDAQQNFQLLDIF